MYGITLGSAECPVFYEDRGKRSFEFSLSETRAIVDCLLSRKARNNGVGKYLSDSLRVKGECRYDFPKSSDLLAFYCKDSGDGKYTVTLLGAYPHELIERLNRPGQQSRAITLTRNVRARRRQLRAQGLYRDLMKRELPRALAGASGNLKLHFRNSDITCSDAIVVIAHAAKLDRRWVRTRLVRSLDKRSVASLRLKGGFVFRVDLACEWRGLLDLTTLVKIRTTDDNTHGVYRRLRNALRKRLNKERKARVAAQERYLLEKKVQKTYRHLVA